MGAYHKPRLGSSMLHALCPFNPCSRWSRLAPSSCSLFRHQGVPCPMANTGGRGEPGVGFPGLGVYSPLLCHLRSLSPLASLENESSAEAQGPGNPFHQPSCGISCRYCTLKSLAPPPLTVLPSTVTVFTFGNMNSSCDPGHSVL